LTDIVYTTILESSRTTYFDNLTGLQNWIGRTFGGAKDHGSAWITGKWNGASRWKWRVIKRGIRMDCDFLRRRASNR